MGIQQDYIEKLEANYKTVYYSFPRKKWFMPNRIKFIIKPIVASDLFSKELLDGALKEMSMGQTLENASRISLEKFQKEFFNLDTNSGVRILFEKGIVFPKIIEKKDEVKNDELPFELLTYEIKVFLLQELIKISPILQRE